MAKKDSLKEEIALLRTFLISAIAICISLISYCVHNFKFNFLFYISGILIIFFIFAISKLTLKIIKLIKKLERLE